MSRHPSPASGKPSRRGRAFAVAAAVTLALSIGHGASRPVAAADDGSSVLDRTYADVAFVTGGPGPSPDLLTLSIDQQNVSTGTVSLLRRTTGWSTVAEAPVQLPISNGFSPWLMQLGPDWFAIVSWAGTDTTNVTPLSVHAGMDPTIVVHDPAQLGLAAAQGGIADVNADGSGELVLLGYRGEQDPCPTPTIAVVPLDNLPTITDTAEILKPSRSLVLSRIGGAALGEWDGRPGVDLLVNAWEGCPNGQEPEVVERHHLLAIRLADLSTIADRPTSDEEASIAAPWGNQPTVVDVDGDGRDEAIVATDAGFKLVDPVDRWRATPFGPAGSVLLSATQPWTGGVGLAWAQRTEDPAVSGIVTARLVRSGGAIHVEAGPPRPVPDAQESEFASAHARLQSAAYGQQRPVFLADVDGDGCQDVVAPLFEIGCDGGGPIRRGRTWIGSRPLAIVGGPDDRGLLVAAGLEWYPYLGGPLPPAPAASQPPGEWRTNSGSTRFVLAEVPVASPDGEQVSVLPRPTIDHLASKNGVVEVRFVQGLRLLFRATPVGVAQTPLNTELLRTQEGFLYSEGQDGEWAGAAADFMGPSSDGGPGTRIQEFDLRTQVTGFDGALADRWTLTVAALDATGTLSDPVQGTAIFDQTAPPLQMQTPTLTPPWPFGAGLQGTSEAGVSVSLPGRPAVVVGPKGTFELPTQLAPWPETLVVTAVDLAGNTTTSELSVMGGVDVRVLPWPAILVGLLLVAVALSSIRGVRGTRQPTVVRSYGDEVTPEIEELPVRPGRPD